MKKLTALTLILCLCLCLSACGGEKAPAATQAPAVTEAPATEVPATEVPATEAPAEATAEPDNGVQEKIELVRSLIDQPVAELYAAIGEPNSSDYASSCLVQGGEDGSLYYDGFTVYTIRANGEETVYDVE